MDWLVQNWVWVLVFAAFIGMHMFGHGGHGGHSGHSGEENKRPTDVKEQSKNRLQGHHH
ncbi:MAG: DUF2933 domain-containing protein [Sideroxydans sp.]|nr:DUF2933 domain-containing protein [Methylotenera sp.]NOT18799.1 DUF2933 domain-containing protein [Sideroxydans sp.]